MSCVTTDILTICMADRVPCIQGVEARCQKSHLLRNAPGGCILMLASKAAQLCSVISPSGEDTQALIRMKMTGKTHLLPDKAPKAGVAVEVAAVEASKDVTI